MVLQHTWDTFPLPHYLLQNESEYIQTCFFYFVSKACKRHFTLLKPWSPDTETGKVQVICENVTKALNKSHPIPFVVFLKKTSMEQPRLDSFSSSSNFSKIGFPYIEFKSIFSSNVFYASVIWQNTLFKRAWTTLRIFTQPTPDFCHYSAHRRLHHHFPPSLSSWYLPFNNH